VGCAAGAALALGGAASAQFAGFAGPAFFSAASSVHDVALGDFDNDGDLDIAACVNTGATFDQVEVFLNNGDGTYGPPTAFGVGGTPVAIEAVDMDKDGDLDLVVANRSSNDGSFLRGNGDGTFAPEVILSLGVDPRDLAIADFNGDTNLDVAAVNFSADTVTTLHGDGAGGFSAGTVFSTQHPLAPNLGDGPRGIVARDFDSDGDVDIVTANSLSGGTVSVFHNIGAGTFFTGDFAFYIVVAVPSRMAAADFDHDGDLDLVAGTVGGGTTVHILLNDGASPNNSFALASSPSVGSRAVFVAAGDLNRDGDIDIVAETEVSDDIRVLIGDGAGGFGPALPFASGQSPNGIRLGDVDLDGDLDAIVGNLISNEIAIHYNLESMVGGVPPVASLSDPAPGACVAGIVDIMGVADVPGGLFGDYELAFKNAANSDPFTTIVSSTTPVPAPGGSLGLWDTTLVPEGRYLLRLRVNNANGLDAEETRMVFVSRDFNRVEFFAAKQGAPPSPVGIVGGRSCIFGFVNDDACPSNTYTVDFRPLGVGPFTPVDPLNPVYAGDRLNEQLALWDTQALALPDGDYELRVEAMNGAGQSKLAPIQVVTVDNTPPTAVVSEPANCSRFEAGSLIVFKGVIDDANLAGWSLQYADGDADAWVTIASGAVAVNGVIAVWDTTGLPPCAYTVRLVVTDKATVNCSSGHRVDNLTNILLQCGGDLTGDNSTGPADLFHLLGNWGKVCP